METQAVETTTSKIEVRTSEQWKLNIKDWLKGLLMVVLSAAVTAIVQLASAAAVAVQNGLPFPLPTDNDFKMIGTVAVIAGGSYLLKQLGTPAQTIITETKK